MSTPHATVIRLSALGDVALTTGVLAHWQHRFGFSFTVITRDSLSPLFEQHPAVADVIGVTSEQLSFLGWLKACRAFVRRLAISPESLLIDLHGSIRSRILGGMWQGQVRSYPKMGLERRLFRHFKSDWAGAKLQGLNVPQRYAMALENEPPDPLQVKPLARLTQEEKTLAAELLHPLDLPKPFLALHPYATHQAKAWPDDKWMELIQKLDQEGIGWFVIGRSDRTLPVLKNKQRDLTNRTGLRQTLALLHTASALVTSDSGPMHLGTAVGTPVIALFGPTTREWGFFPSGEKDIVLQQSLHCRPCSLHGRDRCPENYSCLRNIDPGRVLTALGDVLHASGGKDWI